MIWTTVPRYSKELADATTCVDVGRIKTKINALSVQYVHTTPASAFAEAALHTSNSLIASSPLLLLASASACSSVACLSYWHLQTAKALTQDRRFHQLLLLFLRFHLRTPSQLLSFSFLLDRCKEEEHSSKHASPLRQKKQQPHHLLMIHVFQNHPLHTIGGRCLRTQTRSCNCYVQPFLFIYLFLAYLSTRNGGKEVRECRRTLQRRQKLLVDILKIVSGTASLAITTPAVVAKRILV